MTSPLLRFTLTAAALALLTGGSALAQQNVKVLAVDPTDRLSGATATVRNGKLKLDLAARRSSVWIQ